MSLSPRRTFMVLLFIVFGCNLAFLSACAQEQDDEDAYSRAWKEVSNLLRRREFSSAVARLDSLTKSEDMREFSAQIEADRRAIVTLQILERIVTDQAARLSGGGGITISGLEYTVERLEKSPQGDVLVLTSKALKRESKKLIADLPSGAWVDLAQADLTTLRDPELTLGIFLAFDRVGNQKTARKLLNEAAAKGADVSVWLSRLESATKEKPDSPAGNNDPIVGPWSGRFGHPDHSVAATYDFRRNGTGLMKIDPGLLATWKAPPGQGPKEWAAKKSLLRGGSAFTWKRDGDGTYRITFKLGGVTFDGLVLNNETLRIPGYPVFTRPVGR